MVTKKITLNELRTIVKQIIKEETVNSFNVTKKYDNSCQCHKHIISNFSLDLGNNYTTHQFAEALKKEQEDIVDYLRDVDLSDSVVFIYQGNYGKHKDEWSVYDLWDFLR